MANFTTEAMVRLRFQAHDETLAPAALVEAAIGDAHGTLAPRLAAEFASGEPAEALALAETLLAGAHLLRALAAGAALGRQHIVIGGQRIEPDGRSAALEGLAAGAESRAWRLAAPYLAAAPGRALLRPSATAPVLGEG